MRRRHTFELGTAIVLAAGGAYLLFGVSPRTAEPPKPATEPAATRPAAMTSQPATLPSPATQAAALAQPADVLSVARLDDPKYPTTQPLDLPVDLADAAKIILNRPAYVDPLGNLWLTHSQGRPMADVLAGPIVDRTAVVRETIRYVHWPIDGGVPTAVIEQSGTLLAVTGSRVTVLPPPNGVDFDRAVPLGRGIVAPTGVGAAMFFDAALPRSLEFDFVHTIPLKNPDEPTPPRIPHTRPVLAVAGDAVYVWSPWENNVVGSEYVLRVHADGNVDTLDVAHGWPAKVIEIVPLADGSVLVIHATEAGPAVKLIAAADKPPTAELLRTIRPLARQLADPDPLQREAAQRAIEAQGPAAYPVLESMREQLPPEAQVRIETLLGQRFAPSLGGLRPLEGRCRTIARFPGGGCVLRLDGGGTLDAITGEGGDTPERSVIPATVLIRPGHFIERIDPEAAGDFVPGRQSIQWVGGELIVADPVNGPQKWIGLTRLPILPTALADFDTVVAIDARRRWLLTSAKRPGQTLLIDPSLPDTTPKLPVWTIGGETVGRTEVGWPAVKRGDRLFVLERDGWKIDKPDKLITDFANPTTVTDDAGRRFTTSGHTAEMTGANGGHALVDLPGGVSGATPVATIGRLLVYTPDGKVRRYALGDGTALSLEATFTQAVPPAASHVWLDPAGRLVMTTANAIAVGFPEGRVPAGLGGMMLSVER